MQERGPMNENKKKYDVLVLTASTVDMIIEMEGTFPVEGGCSRRVRASHPEPGGEGNLMIVCSRLGGNVLPVGPIGDDYYGSYLLKAYQEQGIETKFLKKTQDYQTPVANCIIDEKGIHSFVSTIGFSVFDGHEKAPELLEQCKGFYLCGYHLSDQTQPFCGLAMKMLESACERNREIFFDPGPLCRDIEPKMLEEVLAKSTVVALNDEEAEALTGQKDPVRASEALRQRTKALILLKAGARGCYAVSPDTEGRWYPGFKVPVVDTMGAGDSFLGAFIYAWLQKWDLETCVVCANAAGAAKTAKLGTGTQVPTFDETVAIMEKNGYNFPDNARCFHRL